MEENKKSREYWEKRARENENKVYKQGTDLMKELNSSYTRARREIQKSINDLVARYMDKTELSYAEAMKYLTSSEFKEWRMTLEDYEEHIELLEDVSPELAKKVRIELETLAMKSRITRLDSLKTQIDFELNKKAIAEQDLIEKGVSAVYTDFYKMQTTEFGLAGVHTILPKATLERLMQQPWSGENFSERIWGNAEALGKVLKQEIIQSFMQGISVKDLSDRIEKRFITDRYNTERLVRTELNYALNETTKLSYEEAEIEEYEYLAEIDGRTSDICRELNGQKFKMKDAKAGVNYPPMHPHCFDQETEIYTNKGWKFFKDLDKSELVYTINPNTLNVEWQKPINYISYRYKGKMFYYENSRFNLMVTPQHKILVQNMDNSVKNKSWKLKEAIKVGRKSKNRMLSGINWQGKIKNSELLAGEKVDIELYLKFMAYWLADGSCTKDRGSYNIKIAQCENDWMYEELKEIPFKIYKCKESLMIHNKELGNDLSKFGKCTEKYIPENIKELNPELIRIFLMAYAKTDGHIRKGKNWKGYQFNDSIVFFTTSDKMASDLGELILKAGGRPSYYLNKIQGKEIEFRNGKYRINKDCWVISWNTQIHTWISNLNISEVDYNDNVYCVEVLKYNTVLVRRNGKVCWSGNCRSTTVPVIDYENFGKKKDTTKKIEEPKKKDKENVKNDKIEEKAINNCKTVQDVENLMKSQKWFYVVKENNFDSNEELKLEGCDLEAAKQVYIAFEEVYNKFPQLKGKLASVRAYNFKNNMVFAECQGGFGVGGIGLNTQKYKSYKILEKEYKEDIKAGFHPKGTDWTAILTHEFGHAIDDYLSFGLKLASEKSGKVKRMSSVMRTKVLKKVGLKTGDIRSIEQQVSGYATKNAAEFFAECFAEYMKSENPRQVATEFGKQLEEILKEIK